MPKREDESWAGQKERLRYCAVHKRYYRADIGCQLCWEQHLRAKRRPEQPLAPKLEKCPSCKRVSLCWNPWLLLYECLNVNCRKTFAQMQIGEELQHPCPPELTNPLLLSVKMFLADVRSWRQQYRYPEYVCADFAQEVYDAATERGIRCGYAVVNFVGAEVAHAIVAFQTDYGLVFIEPQAGEQLDISLSRPYPTRLEGVPEHAAVHCVDIQWNDGSFSRVG